MNISKETIKRVETEGYVIQFIVDCGYGTYREVAPEEATKMIVSGFGLDEQYLSKWMTAPKKMEVTFKWIMTRLKAERKSTYIDLYEFLKPVFGIQAMSFGVSVDTLFGLEEKKQRVRSKLNDLGLKFREEFSDNGWCYRFIVSKSRENMNILETLKK